MTDLPETDRQRPYGHETDPQSPPMARADARARITAIDSIRAMALLGVMLINMRDISGLTLLDASALVSVAFAIDYIVEVILDVFVERKALSAFSFLFGLSFTLLLHSRISAGKPYVALYLRRLFFLGCFGVINVMFFFWGDILTTYALLGLILLPAFLLPQSLILVVAGALLFAVPLSLAAAGVYPGPPIVTYDDLRALAAFGTDSLPRTIAFNIQRFIYEVRSYSPLGNWNYANIIGLFLLGLWAGRAGILHDVDRHRDLLRRIAVVGIPLGVTMGLVDAVTAPTNPVSTAMRAGVPILALGYIAAAALWLNNPSGAGVRVRDWLAPAGKAALTVYLLSGLLGEIVFYGWGFGLMANVGATKVALITIGIYALLLAFSTFWLRCFRYGPFEWLWRSLTHMRWQPLQN